MDTSWEFMAEQDAGWSLELTATELECPVWGIRNATENVFAMSATGIPLEENALKFSQKKRKLTPLLS